MSEVGKSRRKDGFGRSSGRTHRTSGFRRQTMHKVICDKCSQSCEVPFKPTKGKPVYCSDCFEKEDSPPSYGGFRGKSRSGHESRPDSDNEAEFRKINAKLDKILEMLNND